MIPTATIKLIVSNAPGARGIASGPLGAGSVSSTEITNDSTEKGLIKFKLGLTDSGGVLLAPSGLKATMGGSSAAVVDVATIFAQAAAAATSRLLFGSAANVQSAAIGAQTISGTDGNMTFYVGASSGLVERLRIDAAGVVRPGADNSQTLGASSFRWSTIYAGTGTINTSDEREKQQVSNTSEALLDAWETVDWSAFKFNDAVAAKGSAARWHFGLIAQQVRDALEDAGIDGVTLGLLCHDEWAADDDREAGDRWGLRYDECFAVEAAYQRRRMDQIEVRLAALEA